MPDFGPRRILWRRLRNLLALTYSSLQRTAKSARPACGSGLDGAHNRRNKAALRVSGGRLEVERWMDLDQWRSVTPTVTAPSVDGTTVTGA
jgi:hypothetical protein